MQIIKKYHIVFVTNILSPQCEILFTYFQFSQFVAHIAHNLELHTHTGDLGLKWDLVTLVLSAKICSGVC